MQALKENRSLWLAAYYSGDHQLLRYLESDNFFIEHNHQVDKSGMRYRHIAHLVKHEKWQPEQLSEQQVKFNKRSDTEYLITGIAFSNSITVHFNEIWILEQQRWRIASLIMMSA